MIIFLTWHPENFSVTETIREAVGGHVSSHVEKWSAVRRNETNVQEDAEMKDGESSGHVQANCNTVLPHSLMAEAVLKICKSVSLHFLS